MGASYPDLVSAISRGWTFLAQSLVLACGLCGCIIDETTRRELTNEHEAGWEALKAGHGELHAEELEIPAELREEIRLDHRFGGSSNECQPTSLVAVLKGGKVFCSAHRKVGEECPPPFKHQAQIPAEQVDALLEIAYEEFSKNKAGDESCDGGWSRVNLYDREGGWFYSLSTACRRDEPLERTQSTLREIWDAHCEAGTRPE